MNQLIQRSLFIYRLVLHGCSPFFTSLKSFFWGIFVARSGNLVQSEIWSRAYLVSWTNPVEKYAQVKLDHVPSGWKLKCVKPPPSFNFDWFKIYPSCHSFCFTIDHFELKMHLDFTFSPQFLNLAPTIGPFGFPPKTIMQQNFRESQPRHTTKPLSQPRYTTVSTITTPMMVSKVWLRTIWAKPIRCLDQEPSLGGSGNPNGSVGKHRPQRCSKSPCLRWWVLESPIFSESIACQIWNKLIMLHENSHQKKEKPSHLDWWLVCSGKHGGPYFC